MNKGAAFVRDSVIALIATAILLSAVEGAASLALFVWRLCRYAVQPYEQHHSRHDSELGWVNLPGATVLDAYGAGIDVRINSQGLRGDREYSEFKSAKNLRIICSGDSFTFGYGVNFDQAWPHQLVESDPQIESIDMGLGGYGVDQSYLRYRSDGGRFEHDAHLFAFVKWDFDRMLTGTFSGYPKPTLSVEGGRLVVGNVPVPRPGVLGPRLAAAGPFIRQLRIFELASGSLRLLSGKERELKSYATEPALRETLPAVIASLKELGEERQSTQILVFLPVEDDYVGSDTEDAFRSWLRSEAQSQGVLFFDLVEDLRALKSADMRNLFLREGDVSTTAGPGHYNALGHRFVAEQIYSELLSLGLVDKGAPGSGRRE